ncbi:GNAT family N-acetyltransferase [Streptomyces zagrosensis]|uniref:RimJ/RimL family protein N-acetyltransferase n=1 Tax=Streptomyces zagrosensis TaxID=1042984 RepID=A0A7W9QG66_9ACTN|nr:GNAT family N-acetyltransferase [Streptomyces zagrosensis]MBB5939670.1 RimJ/RimL family protein N-acetyltransferase [Streptomyces zagrosensis]
MAWTTTDDNDAFLDNAGPFVRERPDENTLLLSLADSLRTAGPGRYGDGVPYYGWWRGPRGAVSAAFIWTPPYPVQLSPMPQEAAADLARTLLGGQRTITGAGGRESAATAFAAAWAQETGGVARVTAHQRLYRLGELVPPSPAPPGAARLATEEDRGLLLDWFAAYHRDMEEDPTDSERALTERLSYGGCTLWQVAGVPVAMASVTRPSSGMVRIGGVYTPNEQRRRGYAGAATAAVSQGVLDAGVERVLLFTDLTNPTSNALYQRLGYRTVEDRVTLALDATPVPTHS